MEKQLFTWDNFDVVDTMMFQFYACTLVVPIGIFPAGYKAPIISLDYEHALITIFTDEEIGHVYPLVLTAPNS